MFPYIVIGESILVIFLVSFCIQLFVFCVITTSVLSQDRPSTKVHAAPGGGSSLGYLFGGGSSN